MSSERAEQPATPDNPGRIPGKTLAAQREAMGWTVEQVADQLKLHVRQVAALEAGDYAKLPSPAVTRGFVRAYAKLVRLDPAPLVGQIEMDVPPTPDTSATLARRASPTSFSGSRFPSNGKRSPMLPIGLIAGAVVAIAAAAAAAWHFGVLPHRSAEPDTAPATAAAPAGSPAEPAAGTSGAGAGGNAVETLQNPSVPLISVPSPNATPAAGATSGAAPSTAAPSTAPSGATPATTTPAGRPQAQAQPVTAGGAAAATGPAVVQPVTKTAAVAPTAGANPLVLNVRADSWIEVRPAKGGAPLLSRLVKAGAVETVNVDQPVRVTVGNPGGVSATLRGNPVALPEVPGKTLARVNLQ